MSSEFQQEIRDYLVNEFSVIEHPAYPLDRSRQVEWTDIEDIVDAFLALLRSPTTLEGTESLWRDVREQFKIYLESPGDLARRVTAARSLATKLEPFMKKLYAKRFPGESLPRSLGSLLESVAGYNKDKLLYRPEPEELRAFLEGQPTEEAIMHKAYHARHLSAHEARWLSPGEEFVYWRSVVAAFLLIARRNMDLVPAIRDRAESAARIRSGLRVCLENVRGRFDDTRWRNEYYIPLSIDKGGGLDEYVDVFLRDQTDRLLVIAGRTGAGKSTFLERLATQLADQALTALSAETTDRILIPVHLELKRYVPTKRMYLVKKLYNEFDSGRTLEIRTRRVARWPEVISHTGMLVCLLDGLDESRAYEEVIQEIEGLVADFDNVKVIVTSRPDAIPEHWKDRQIFITPLPPEEVIAYFGHPERLNLLAPDVQAFLEDKPDLVDILRDPLMAEAACRYWQQFEPSEPTSELDPSIRRKALLEGPLFDHLYQCFFDHHLRRVFGRQIKDYERNRQMSALASLAMKMDGNPLANFELITKVFERFERRATTRDDLLERFVDIGLLKPDNNDFGFRNDTVKAYFAAVGLRSHTRTRRGLDQALSLITQANEFWRYCLELLKQMAPLDDLSPIEGHLASLAKA